MKNSSLKPHNLCLAVVLFLVFSSPVFADEVVLNLKTKIYHRISGQHSLYCSDCAVTERNKAEELFNAKPCKICLPVAKIHKKKNKSHKKRHKSKRKKTKHRKAKRHHSSVKNKK